VHGVGIDPEVDQRGPESSVAPPDPPGNSKSSTGCTTTVARSAGAVARPTPSAVNRGAAAAPTSS
jgi:hypothetical protein